MTLNQLYKKLIEIEFFKGYYKIFVEFIIIDRFESENFSYTHCIIGFKKHDIKYELQIINQDNKGSASYLFQQVNSFSKYNESELVIIDLRNELLPIDNKHYDSLNVPNYQINENFIMLINLKNIIDYYNKIKLPFNGYNITYGEYIDTFVTII